MLKAIRTEQIGKITLRLLQSEDGYVGAVIGGAPCLMSMATILNWFGRSFALR